MRRSRQRLIFTRRRRPRSRLLVLLLLAAALAAVAWGLRGCSAHAFTPGPIRGAVA
jgi:hypothetical protein